MRSDLLRGWRPIVGVVAVGVLAFAWNLHGETAGPGSGAGQATAHRGLDADVPGETPTRNEASQSGAEEVLLPSDRSLGAMQGDPAKLTLNGASAEGGIAAVGDPCACDGDCSDGNDCTINECDLATNQCLASAPVDGGEACANDGDGDGCTRGTCGAGDGSCTGTAGGDPCGGDTCTNNAGEAVCTGPCTVDADCADDPARCRSGVCGADGYCDLVSDCTVLGETCDTELPTPACVADVGRCCRDVDNPGQFCEALPYATCILSTCGGAADAKTCTDAADCAGEPVTTCDVTTIHPWTDFPACTTGCPKYSAGFGQGGPDPRSYVTVTDRPCSDLNRIGDDYTTRNLQWLDLTAFAIRGWANGYQDMACPYDTCGGVPCGTACPNGDTDCVGNADGESCLSTEVANPGSIVVQFWDASGAIPVITAGFSGNVSQQVCEGTDDSCLNNDDCAASVPCIIDPTPVPQRVVWNLSAGDPFQVPGIGFVTVRPAAGSGETFNWELADLTEVSPGLNNGDLLWINAGPAGAPVIGAGQDVLSFELIGGKTPPPTGACCDSADGSCTDVIEAICTQTYCVDDTDGTVGVVCGGLYDPPCVAGETCLQTGTWQKGVACGGGTPDAVCSDGACCDAATGDCSSTSQGACGGTFLGFGTDCRPNCCDQPTFQTGAICSDAPIVPIHVLVTAGGDPLQTCGGVIGGTGCFSDAACAGNPDGITCELAVTEITISGDNTDVWNGYCENSGICAGNGTACSVDDGTTADQDCLGAGPCNHVAQDQCSTQTDGTDCGFTCGGCYDDTCDTPGGTSCTTDADCTGNPDGITCEARTCVLAELGCLDWPGDPVQHIAFHIDRTSDVEIDFCCTSGASQGGAKGLMYFSLNQQCDLVVDPPECGGSVFYDFGNQGTCGDDNNRIFYWPGLENGTYWYPISGDTWCEGQVTQPTDGCERDSDCDPGFFCVEDQGPYTVHIRATALRREVCCLQSFRCGGDLAGAVCDTDTDCTSDPAGTICGGLCETLTAPDCDAAGGFSVTGAPVCQGGSDGSCMKGSCCLDTPDPVFGNCDDASGVQVRKTDCTNGNFIGGSTCNLDPCPVCLIEDTANCQSWIDPIGSNWMLRIDRSLVDGNGEYTRHADDFIPATSGQITSVCWWPGYVMANAPTGVPAECSDPIDQPANQQWRVDFYYGNGGIPGKMLMSVPIDDADIVRQGLPDPWRGWNYSAQIAGPTVTAGEIYWISFSAMGDGNGESDCNVFWYQSVGGNGWAVQDTNFKPGDDPESWEDSDIERVLDEGGADEGIFDLSWCIDIGRDPTLGEYNGTCCHCDGATCDVSRGWTDCNDVVLGNWFSRSLFCGGVEYGTPCESSTDCVGNPDGTDCTIGHLCPAETGSTFTCPGSPLNDFCPTAEVISHGGSTTCGGVLGGTACTTDPDCAGNPDGAICGPEDINVFYDNRCATSSSPNFAFSNCECDGCVDPWNSLLECDISGTSRDQWYSYVAPCNGIITVDDCEEVAASDPIIAIYNLNVTTCGGVAPSAGGTVCVDFRDCVTNADSDQCAADECCQIAVDEDCPVVNATASVICSDERCVDPGEDCNAAGGVVSLAVTAGERYMIRNGNFDAGSRGSGFIALHIACAAGSAPEAALGADEMAVPGSATWPPATSTTCTTDAECLQEAVCLPDAAGNFPGTCYVPKNRYLAVAPNPNNDAATARRLSVELTQRLCEGTGAACTKDSECAVSCDDLPISCANDGECNAVATGAVCASTGTCVQVLGWFGAPGANGFVRVEVEANRHKMIWTDGQYPIDCGVDPLCPANSYCDTGSGGSVTCRWDADDTEVLWDFVFLGDCHISPQIRDVRPLAAGGLEENKAPRYYLVESILDTADVSDESAYSRALIVPTVRVWGDETGGVQGGISRPPEGAPGFLDILGQVGRFKDLGQAHMSWLDIHPEQPDGGTGFLDMLASVNAFKDAPYPFSDPCSCSGLTSCP